MTVPTIHLNGTSKQDLMDRLEAASNSLEQSYAYLKQTAPNGRDYYPQGAEALPRAADEHMDRLRRLDAIKREIDEILVAIAEQARAASEEGTCP